MTVPPAFLGKQSARSLRRTRARDRIPSTGYSFGQRHLHRRGRTHEPPIRLLDAPRNWSSKLRIIPRMKRPARGSARKNRKDGRKANLRLGETLHRRSLRQSWRVSPEVHIADAMNTYPLLVDNPQPRGYRCHKQVRYEPLRYLECSMIPTRSNYRCELHFGAVNWYAGEDGRAATRT